MYKVNVVIFVRVLYGLKGSISSWSFSLSQLFMGIGFTACKCYRNL